MGKKLYFIYVVMFTFLHRYVAIVNQAKYIRYLHELHLNLSLQKYY